MNNKNRNFYITVLLLLLFQFDVCYCVEPQILKLYQTNCCNESTKTVKVRIIEFLKRYILNIQINKYSFLLNKNISKDRNFLQEYNLTEERFYINKKIADYWGIEDANCFKFQEFAIPDSISSIRNRLFLVEYTNYREVPARNHRNTDNLYKEYYYVYWSKSGEMMVINEAFPMFEQIRRFNMMVEENSVKIDKDNIVDYIVFFINVTRNQKNKRAPIIITDEKTKRIVNEILTTKASRNKSNLNYYIPSVTQSFNPINFEEKYFIVQIYYYVPRTNNNFGINGFSDLYKMTVVATKNGKIVELYVDNITKSYEKLFKKGRAKKGVE